MDTRLLVLGLLSMAPMHGYEIKKTMERSRAAVWAAVLPGSVYHALKTMAAEGLVEVKATEASGHRTRAIYAITPAGCSEMKRLLREAWRQPPRPYPVTLYSAIALFHVLPGAELVDAIERLIEEARREITTWNDAEKRRAAAGSIPSHLRLAFGNAREHLEADIRLLEGLKDLAQERAH